MKIERYQAYKDSTIAWLSEVPKHWQFKRIKELTTTISKGTTPSTEGFTFIDEGVRFIKAENVSNTKIVSKFPAFYISEEANEGLSRSKLKLKDLLIVIAGATIGKVGIVDETCLPANTNQAVCFVRFKKTESIDFLYYLFSSDYFVKYVWYNIVQSAQPNLSMGVLGNFLLFIPTSSEQKAIARYLDTKTAQIDRKIDLLTQKATLYSNLKQSLMNETVTRGLDKSVPMKDSGIEWIGEVPKHWKVKRFKDFSTILSGYSPEEIQPDTTGEIPYYKVDDLNSLSDAGFISLNTWYAGSSRRSYSKNILLLPKRGMSILSNKVGITNLECLFDTNLMGLRLHPRNSDNKYIYYWILSASLSRLADINTIPQLNNKHIYPLLIYSPPLSEQKVIANYLDTKTAQIDQIIQTINTQIEKLKELRKTLINDVVTGKIKVV